MRRNFIVIFGAHMFVEVFLLTHLALLPTFIEEFKLTLLQASLIASIPSLLVILSYMPIGVLADKFGAKPFLMGSMLIEGAAALLVSQARDFWTLVAGISLLRISSPTYHIAGMSAISNMVKGASTSRALGYHNALGSFGTTIGLLSLSLIAWKYGWRTVYLVWAIPIMLWCIPILKSEILRVRKSLKVEEKEGRALTNLSSVLTPKFVSLLVITSLQILGSSAISTFLTTYLVEYRGFSQEISSLIFSLGPLTGIFGSLISGYLSSRFGDERFLMATITCSAFSLIFLYNAVSLEYVLAAYGVYSLFINGMWSPIGSLVATLTPKENRGIGYSSYFLTSGISATIQPVIMAIIIEHTDLSVIFPIAMGLMLLSALLIKIFSIKPTRQH